MKRVIKILGLTGAGLLLFFAVALLVFYHLIQIGEFRRFLNQEGVRFRSVTADFKVAQGVYATQNLLVDSDDIRITGAGEMDGPKGETDFVIAVRPFPGVDSAVNYLPLIGQGLAAIKNSLLVASFNVRGPVDDPSVTPTPLSTLSEFFYGALAIPKGVIGLPREEKK